MAAEALAPVSNRWRKRRPFGNGVPTERTNLTKLLNMALLKPIPNRLSTNWPHRTEQSCYQFLSSCLVKIGAIPRRRIEARPTRSHTGYGVFIMPNWLKRAIRSKYCVQVKIFPSRTSMKQAQAIRVALPVGGMPMRGPAVNGFVHVPLATN